MLCSSFSCVVVTMTGNASGIHPHDAKTFQEGRSIEKLKELAIQKNCVAIGECGLDFNRNFSPQDDQRNAFRQQVTGGDDDDV